MMITVEGLGPVARRVWAHRWFRVVVCVLVGICLSVASFSVWGWAHSRRVEKVRETGELMTQVSREAADSIGYALRLEWVDIGEGVTAAEAVVTEGGEARLRMAVKGFNLYSQEGGRKDPFSYEEVVESLGSGLYEYAQMGDVSQVPGLMVTRWCEKTPSLVSKTGGKVPRVGNNYLYAANAEGIYSDLKYKY